MENILLLIISWYLWMIQTFLIGKQNRYRFVSSLFLLVIISFYPLDWSFMQVTIKPVFILFFAGGFLCLCKQTSVNKWKIFFMSISFAYLFAALRLTEWYEPVIFLFGHLLTYIICFTFIFFLFFHSFKERLACAIIASCSGEIIYQLHIFPLTSLLHIGEVFFLNYLITLIAALYSLELLHKLVTMINNVVSPSRSNLPG